MSTDTITVEGSGHECDVKLDTWLRDLLPYTPGCMPAVRKRSVILACREFFEQSCAWRVTVGPKRLVANKRRYYMSPYDAYANVVRVFAVAYNGYPLRQYAARPPGTEPDAAHPLGWYIENSGPDQIRFWPASNHDEEASLTFYVALMPKQSVTHLPRVAASHFYDAILDGAAGRLMAQPAKPYSDPVRAQYHLQRFRAAIGKYSGQAKMNFAGAPTWTFPRFGK